jgi:hypothetical protein
MYKYVFSDVKNSFILKYFVYRKQLSLVVKDSVEYTTLRQLSSKLHLDIQDIFEIVLANSQGFAITFTFLCKL